MKVHGYCSACPLKGDPLADVRGRDCPWGCKRARQEAPPYDVTVRGPRAGEVWGMCSECGAVTPQHQHVLDVLVRCIACGTIFRLKGTGTWWTKRLARWHLSPQQKRDRNLSHLWP